MPERFICDPCQAGDHYGCITGKGQPDLCQCTINPDTGEEEGYEEVLERIRREQVLAEALREQQQYFINVWRQALGLPPEGELAEAFERLRQREAALAERARERQEYFAGVWEQALELAAEGGLGTEQEMTLGDALERDLRRGGPPKWSR